MPVFVSKKTLNENWESQAREVGLKGRGLQRWRDGPASAAGESREASPREKWKIFEVAIYMTLKLMARRRSQRNSSLMEIWSYGYMALGWSAEDVLCLIGPLAVLADLGRNHAVVPLWNKKEEIRNFTMGTALQTSRIAFIKLCELSQRMCSAHRWCQHYRIHISLGMVTVFVWTRCSFFAWQQNPHGERGAAWKKAQQVCNTTRIEEAADLLAGDWWDDYAIQISAGLDL